MLDKNVKKQAICNARFMRCSQELMEDMADKSKN